jgi:hypothetical protein
MHCKARCAWSHNTHAAHTLRCRYHLPLPVATLPEHFYEPHTMPFSATAHVGADDAWSWTPSGAGDPRRAHVHAPTSPTSMSTCWRETQGGHAHVVENAWPASVERAPVTGRRGVSRAADTPRAMGTRGAHAQRTPGDALSMSINGRSGDGNDIHHAQPRAAPVQAAATSPRRGLPKKNTTRGGGAKSAVVHAGGGQGSAHIDTSFLQFMEATMTHRQQRDAAKAAAAKREAASKAKSSSAVVRRQERRSAEDARAQELQRLCVFLFCFCCTVPCDGMGKQRARTCPLKPRPQTQNTMLGLTLLTNTTTTITNNVHDINLSARPGLTFTATALGLQVW